MGWWLSPRQQNSRCTAETVKNHAPTQLGVTSILLYFTAYSAFHQSFTPYAIFNTSRHLSATDLHFTRTLCRVSCPPPTHTNPSNHASTFILRQTQLSSS